MKGTRYFETSETTHPMTQRHATVNAEDGVTNDVLLFTVACTSWHTLTWLQVVSSPIKPSILGASAKFRKATINFVMSVCPSIRLCVYPFAWYNCAPTGRTVMRKSLENIQLSLQYDENKGYFTWKCIYIYDNISLISS